MFITPVIVSCPQNISPADLDRPAKGSRALQGKAGAAWGEPAQPESLAGNMCAARHGQVSVLRCIALHVFVLGVCMCVCCVCLNH